MDLITTVRIFGLLSLAVGMTACGGGDSSAPAAPQNRAPVASAGMSQIVDELAPVTLDGSASSDPDGDALTYSWSQTAGESVTISNATMAMASFDAPDVLASASPEILTFRLTVSDGSASSSATVDVTVNDAGLGANTPPSANAGPDQSVVELTNVDLDGTASSDADNDALSFAWQQLDGPLVALGNPNTATPSFQAPDVAAGIPATLTFELTVDDGTETATDTVAITVSESLAAVSVSGRLFYEQPQRNDVFCRGYNFDNIINRPIRRAPVELRDDLNNVIASTVTADDGSYAFTGVDPNVDVRLRVRSESVQVGPVSWNVQVRDNTSLITQPLVNRPLYAVEFGPFNTGGSNLVDQDFVATTGWGTNSYTGTRAAAPFSILDALVDGIIMIEDADSSVDMGELDAYWSVNNTWVADVGLDNLDNGELPTTFYTSNPDGDNIRNPSLFLLGDAIGLLPETIAIDTDEFDRGVIIHEWGHFFEDELSRSDSIGGRHVIPGELEPRVAFGEGWGYGIAAIAGGDPLLCDTGEPATSGSSLDIETWRGYGTHGFFNEMSVATFLYDLFDAANEGAEDDGSIGFAPIYATMTGPQANTEAFTTLFSFAAELAPMLNQTDLEFLRRMLEREDIDTGLLDIWGSGQTTPPSGWRDVLPVYEILPTNGTTLSVCANNDLDPDGDGNKPGEWRYLRFTTTSASRWRVQAQANPLPPAAPPTDPVDAVDVSDPDLWMYRVGDLINICPGVDCLDTGSGVSGDPNSETMDTALLAAGTYVIAFNEYVYGVDNIASNFPDRMCFDITANPL